MSISWGSYSYRQRTLAPIFEDLGKLFIKKASGKEKLLKPSEGKLSYQSVYVLCITTSCAMSDQLK
jgi:hypothetical protein